MVPVIFIAFFLLAFYLTITGWVTFVNHIEAKDYGNAFWLFFGFLSLACITTFPLAFFFKARNILIIFLLVLFVTALLGQQKKMPQEAPEQAAEVSSPTQSPVKDIEILEQKAAHLWLNGDLPIKSEEFWSEYEDLLTTMKSLT